MLPLLLMHVRIRSAAERERDNYVSGVKECTAKMEDFTMRYRSDLLTWDNTPAGRRSVVEEHDRGAETQTA